MQSHTAYQADNRWPFANYNVLSVNCKGVLSAPNPLFLTGRESKQASCRKLMMSKLKPQRPIGVTQLNGGLRKMVGFFSTGNTKCKGLEMKSTFFEISNHSLLQENKVGVMGQNTHTLVVHAKRMSFVLIAIESYRRVHPQVYILVKKEYPKLVNKAMTKDRQGGAYGANFKELLIFRGMQLFCDPGSGCLIKFCTSEYLLSLVLPLSHNIIV